MNGGNRGFARPAALLVSALLPALMILASVFLLLHTAKAWAAIEYRMPGFPPDPYGFTTEDRIRWSRVDIDYLLRGEDLSYFDNYTLDTGAPMHNARELRHMQDVKVLLDRARAVLLGGVIAVMLMLMALASSGQRAEAALALRRASRWTLALMLAIGISLALAFGVLFVGFHRIFFEGDTWLFRYSDTFIRLYPERFWRDAFAMIVVLTLVQAGLLGWAGSRLLRRASGSESRD